MKSDCSVSEKYMYDCMFLNKKIENKEKETAALHMGFFNMFFLLYEITLSELMLCGTEGTSYKCVTAKQDTP